MKYKLLLLLTCTLVACSNNDPVLQATAPVAESTPVTDMPVGDAPLDPTGADAGQAATNASNEPVAPQGLSMLGSSPNLPTLVSSYKVMRDIGGNNQPEYVGSIYRPRQVAAGTAIEVDTHNADHQKSTIIDPKTYVGWDLLLPKNYRSLSIDTRPDWFSITLNRAATLAVGVRTPNVPSWLRSWNVATPLAVMSSGKLETIRMFSKTFAAGPVNLGGVSAGSGGDNVYIVMLAEQNGAPSAAPSVPTSQETPKPNSACPTWVHDQYIITGPDGKQYRTWHPQIDPVYWCTFGHEHGSDPSLAGSAYKVAFGYTATLGGMSEPHTGFKINVFRNPSGGFWVINQHFGTSGVGRACVSMHTVDMALVQNNVIKADLHFMGDFGKGQVVTMQTSQDITGCVNAMVMPGSDGVRKINLQDNSGYEPWRMDSHQLNIGLTFNSLTFDTGDAMTGCASVACTALVTRPGNSGADHRITHESDMVVKGNGETQGTFYTNPTGTKLVDASTAGAVKQYIKPDLSVTAKFGHTVCFTQDPWRGLMTCGGKLMIPIKNLENGLGEVN